ncbi:rRNA biogenesis protein RRP5-like [Euphorbia lathyris]|uniref:rRNA biogenesis protein RRP5-like n=1 Tax=Euphorbia lathyris TaxID=212925 RepID=UPI00331351F0
MQIDDEATDFPRGGGSSLSHREREEIRAEVDAGFKAPEMVLMKKKKGKKLQTKSHSEADDFGSLFGDRLTGKLPRFANKITSKNISAGMKLWGVVAEVNEKDLVISLPGGLRGLVRSIDALDPVLGRDVEGVEVNLGSIFDVGQLVSCIVLQLDADKKDDRKRKIWLSLRLSLLQKGLLNSIQEGMVLTAYVKSIEDHGYMLHFGLPSLKGFLPKNSPNDSSSAELKTGQLVQGIVKRIDVNMVHLSSNSDEVSKFVLKDLKGISMDLLVPGMMVNARVQSTLENGIMLSFLTFYSGTVDMFHLQNKFSASNWKDCYSNNDKVTARILFIDPSTRAVGLTLNQHLVNNHAPPMHVNIGDIYDSAKVVRVDKGMGLLLEIPSDPVSTPAYVSISDVAENEVHKLEKKFKEGSKVRVRILGYRHLEGLATGLLKASAFEGTIFTHSDVKPGMVVRAKIIAVKSFGATVQFPGQLKALCPLSHMSEFEIAKPRKKFKVGAELLFGVLGCKKKMITVTHKKTLVKSKLPILSSYVDASDGLITHGWITKIEKHGCFVHFYNGVQGFAPRSELGLEPGIDASTGYKVGQVIKCRVVSSIPASRRINLSFTMKPTRVSEEETVKLGSVVAGVVEKVMPHAVVVYVNSKGCMRGTISTEHLADYKEQADKLKSVLKPGYEFDQLLVLDIGSKSLVLSAKYSLINSACQIPSEFSQICPQSVVHGYICNIIETGCFVRFLGHLTGFSPRRMTMDDQKAQLAEAFYIGQSVRSNIIDVNSETNRITVSMKQSSCFSTDASFLESYFRLEDKVRSCMFSDSISPDMKWLESFKIGSVIEAKVKESKDVGIVVTFDKYNGVVGFIAHYQLGQIVVETGSTVRAAVLDVLKSDRFVELSLKPQFLDKSSEERSNSLTHKKKRKRELSKELELHQTVNAVVEIVKENYLILSIPEHDYAIGYASVSDYNTQKLPQKHFLNGQSVLATVMEIPSPSNAGKLLLLLKSIREVTETSSSKKAKKKSSYDVGSLVQAEITEKKSLEMRLKFGIGFRGRISITEVNDDCVENPFEGFRIGQTVTARIVAKASKSDKNKLWELSVKPKMITDFCELGDKLVSENHEFSLGQHVSGYVYKVDSDWAWITVSRNVKAQLFILDSGNQPNELQEFQKRFFVGKAVNGNALSYSKEKKLLRLVLHPFCAVSGKHFDGKAKNMNEALENVPHDLASSHIHEGEVVGGRISKILPGVGGLVVQIGPHLHGRVHFTELQDSWVSDPLSCYREGQFVQCKVLEISSSVQGTIHVDLSLRSSLDGMLSRNSTELSENVDAPSQRVEKVEDLHPNTVVQGYVKNVTPKGCFILLSRKIDARILISHLSDEFIENPEKEFPTGKLVIGRVVSVEPLSKRVEVTLKKSNACGAAKSGPNDLSHLHVGDKISGRIKRVEPYGLFIAIDHTNSVGLCHVSELSDDHGDNIQAKYRAGEKVTARILKVDEERHRISLGMKDLENGNYVGILPSEKETAVAISEDDGTDDDGDNKSLDSSSHGLEMMDFELENEEPSLLIQAEARASVPPLDVTLDDVEQSDTDDVVDQNQEHIDEEKNNRRAKKKAKEEREKEISAAEDRVLENDKPSTADDFEKLIRSSPNNSFIWINYMDFLLKLADIEKARSIAERALRTINVREEHEKLNIWLAYFNLENEHGNPPGEDVKKVFQRALQYCDPKKVHLALLGMYERTEQHKLADELLDRMVKKFRTSCKIWLKRVHRLLKQEQEGIQAVIQRALLSLPHHKHIKFISQTAILEFKCGVPDRGRSMFEGILREYPKRTDLWSVYIDQEIKLGDADVTRALFERAISLSLPPKKMKFLFKKYLEYERSLGDEDKIESVKQKAMEYVETTLA